MDPYHWPKQRPQQPRPTQPQPPSQSPRPQPQQPSLRTSSAPSFLSQPLMSTGFPTYAHSSHPPPPPPYQTMHRSQNVGDTMVPHPHSYQNVQNPLTVPLQHPLPQLPQLHHHSINSQTQSNQHPSNQPSLQIQHPRIPHSSHPPHLQPPQQPHPQQPPQQQQQQQQEQQQSSQNPQQQPRQQTQNQQQQQRQQQPHQSQHQQPQQQPQPQQPQPQQTSHPPSSSQQLPPQQHTQPQSNQPHHQSHHRSHLHPPPHQHQQSRTIPIQPPPRQPSPPTLPSPQSRAHHSPHPRDSSSAQHMSAQTSVNPQAIGQQLPHLNQTPQQQQLSQHSMQQAPSQQSQQHQPQPSAQAQQQQYRQHPQHHRQQPCEPARVVYDSSSVYRLSQPQQQYFNPYSTAQQQVQPQQLNQHPSMYSSMPVPSHEYQQQPGSVTIPQETAVRSLPSQRMPPIHQHPPPNQHQLQPQPHIPQQQQQTPQHIQSAQRPHKLVAPLQPQPMQMVPMSRAQGQQHQDGQPLHHAHQQAGDSGNRQSLPPAPPPQAHQLSHSQQPRHITQAQPVPSNPTRPQVPERRSSPAHMQPPPPQSQVHMTSAPIPSTMQLQSHHHQMQQQVMAGQPMQPRDRQHTMQPLISQKPKGPHHSVIQQQGTQQGKMPQAPHLVQQSAQSNEPAMMSRHAGQQYQDATSKHLPQSSGGALRSDLHVASVGGGERQPVKQEQIPEQSVGVRQLKVEDALAYLEQVKSQFSNNPGVYNHFLDIMKEFKANTINTAEVIRRVSSLFQGHRKLILGFNTFLPPGYKIELRSDPTTGCVTGFSSPGGVFCPLMESAPEPHPDARHQSASLAQHAEIRGPPPHITSASVDLSSQHLPPHGRQGVSQTGDVLSQEQHPGIRPGFDHGGYHQPISVAEKEKHVVLVPQSQEGTSISHDMKSQAMQQAPKDNAAVALAERFASPEQGVPAPGKRIEFEQAVTYVNKIKSRFADDQQAYQTFLGILQTYQKEQKSIKDVYKQVSHLFRDHEDLLREFSNFLPEQSPQTQRQAGGPSQRTASDAAAVRNKAHTSQVKQQSALEGAVVENTSPTYPGAKKEKSSKSLGRGRPSKPGSASLAPSGGISKPVTSSRQKPSVQEKKGRKGAGTGKKSGHDGKAALTPGSGHGSQLASSEGATPELEFFDELRSLLGPDGQQNYSEFIKCLSLFSQEIICGDELMRLADGLLSHRKPLTDAFRAFLDQSDSRATQTAVEILRRAKASAEGLDRPGSSLRGPPAPPVVSTPAVRERLRDLPPLVGIGTGGTSANAPGSRSPKLNPLYKGKPLSQIGRDFGTELAGTSSYVTLPADVVQVQCSGMTTDDRNVLNHMFISKSDKAGYTLLHDASRIDPAIEDSAKFSSGLRGQNVSFGAPLHSATGSQNSKSLSTKGTETMSIEDQRLELEVMIARAETTSEKLEQLTKGETRNLSGFIAVDFKPIELVYKDASFDIIDVLRTNPSVTAPVVLKRLRQRLTDWHTSRKKIERLWKSSRFTGFSRLKRGPRTWRKSELKEELMCSRTKNDMNDHNANRDSLKRAIDCDLVCEDENLSVICDILWYAFEWEAEDVETADKGLEFVERLYGVIQKAHRKEVALYVDEHLYVYLRLLAEVSQRVKYVLEHNYDGLTTQSLVQKVKDVLGGTVLLPAYDDHCRKLYGDSGEWASFLSDFPVVCKRLAEAALAVPEMQTSSELLHHAEGIVHSEDGDATRDGDVVMKETTTEVSSKKTSSHVSAEDVTQRLRSALKVVAASRDEIFEVKVLQNRDETLEESGNDPKDVNETKRILRMRHVPRETASQFERLKQEADEEQPISSAVTKYIRRVMKRKRQHDLICGSESEKPVMYQTDGLDVRVNEGSGEKLYVMGTEDFFMKSTFFKRKAVRLALP